MSDTDFIDEEQIFFKRFPEEKQDQVRGLVNYATLMGLTGKDLVSIGGKLDRLNAQRELARNKEIVKSYNHEPIGDDRNRSSREEALDERFKVKTTNGIYHFKRSYSDEWKVTNINTKVTKSHSPQPYDLGRVSWSRRLRYRMVLDLAHGHFQLNF
jgi:hypothetical protein